jgi:hypothetical protein
MTGPARFLHVGFNTANALSKATELEGVFDAALDWIRYAPNCWILRTTTDSDTWAARLKPHLGENDMIFICELDMSNRDKYSGWLQEWMWPRLQSPKT